MHWATALRVLGSSKSTSVLPDVPRVRCSNAAPRGFSLLLGNEKRERLNSFSLILQQWAETVKITRFVNTDVVNFQSSRMPEYTTVYLG